MCFTGYIARGGLAGNSTFKSRFEDVCESPQAGFLFPGTPNTYKSQAKPVFV